MKAFAGRRPSARHGAPWLAVPVAAFGLLAGPLAVLGGPASAATTAFQNGSFETGSYTDAGSGFMTLDANTTSATAITGWSVTSGTVDWVGSYWTAENGSYSLDMNGNGPGAIAQTFSTVQGRTYSVQFYLAGNFECDPATRILDVSATGGTTRAYRFAEPTDYSLTNMGWTGETYTFVASGTATTLTFAADTNDQSACGPALDNVSVTETLTSGSQCKDGGWRGITDPVTGTPYRNQGQCVSSFAREGDTPIGAPDGSGRPSGAGEPADGPGQGHHVR